MNLNFITININNIDISFIDDDDLNNFLEKNNILKTAIKNKSFKNIHLSHFNRFIDEQIKIEDIKTFSDKYFIIYSSKKVIDKCFDLFNKSNIENFILSYPNNGFSYLLLNNYLNYYQSDLPAHIVNYYKKNLHNLTKQINSNLIINFINNYLTINEKFKYLNTIKIYPEGLFADGELKKMNNQRIFLKTDVQTYKKIDINNFELMTFYGNKKIAEHLYLILERMNEQNILKFEVIDAQGNRDYHDKDSKVFVLIDEKNVTAFNNWFKIVLKELEIYDKNIRNENIEKLIGLYKTVLEKELINNNLKNDIKMIEHSNFKI